MIDLRAEVLRLADKGAPTAQIVMELGITRQYVSQILNSEGYEYVAYWRRKDAQ